MKMLKGGKQVTEVWVSASEANPKGKDNVVWTKVRIYPVVISSKNNLSRGIKVNLGLTKVGENVKKIRRTWEKDLMLEVKKSNFYKPIGFHNKVKCHLQSMQQCVTEIYGYTMQGYGLSHI